MVSMKLQQGAIRKRTHAEDRLQGTLKLRARCKSAEEARRITVLKN